MHPALFAACAGVGPATRKLPPRRSRGVWQLIGSEHSYYTGKVRAYLRLAGVPFEEVLATSQMYGEVCVPPPLRAAGRPMQCTAQVIVPRTGVAFIPVVVTPCGGAVLQDSTDIIETIERTRPLRAPRMLPCRYGEPVRRTAALLVCVCVCARARVVYAWTAVA